MSRENIVLTREERELQLEYAQRAGQSLRDRLGRQPMGCVVTERTWDRSPLGNPKRLFS